MAREWRGEVVRAVAFTQTAELRARDLFSQISGADPDNFQTLRTPVPGSVANGRWGDFQLSVAVQPNRIEAAVSAAETDDGAAEITRLDEALKLARTAGISFAALPLIRIAAHVRLIKTLAAATDGPAELNQLLERELFPKGAIDLEYRVNLTKAGFKARPGVLFNRMSTWGTGVQGSVVMGLDASGNPLTQRIIDRAILYLHLDFNNEQLATSLDPAAAQSVTNEIWDEATEVVTTNGYRIFA